MKGKKSKFFKNILWGVFWVLVGIALSVSSFLVPTIQVEPYLKWIVLSLGALIMVIAAVCIAVFAGHMSHTAKDDVEQGESADGVSKGKQAVDQKLAQVDLMDDIQFVMYIFRLFQARGYVVRLTPAFNNYGVSFVAQKDDVSTAVVCLASAKTVGRAEVETACAGWTKYPCKYATLVTNANADKTARRFAKKNNISLVDRTELVNRFM